MWLPPPAARNTPYLPAPTVPCPSQATVPAGDTGPFAGSGGGRRAGPQDRELGRSQAVPRGDGRLLHGHRGSCQPGAAGGRVSANGGEPVPELPGAHPGRRSPLSDLCDQSDPCLPPGRGRRLILLSRVCGPRPWDEQRCLGVPSAAVWPPWGPLAAPGSSKEHCPGVLDTALHLHSPEIFLRIGLGFWVYGAAPRRSSSVSRTRVMDRPHHGR